MAIDGSVMNLKPNLEIYLSPLVRNNHQPATTQCTRETQSINRKETEDVDKTLVNITVLIKKLKTE